MKSENRHQWCKTLSDQEHLKNNTSTHDHVLQIELRDWTK